MGDIMNTPEYIQSCGDQVTSIDGMYEMADMVEQI
jgi:hypothetical protein